MLCMIPVGMSTYIKFNYQIGKSSKSDIKSVASGLIFFLCGGVTPSESVNNLFSYDSDLVYCDEAKKPVYPGQKPVAFMKRLVQLFTAPGYWIFDGTGEIGKPAA